MNFTRQQTIDMLNELLQRPDLLLNAISEEADHDAESLLTIAEEAISKERSGMAELKIYQFQAEQIKDTLRMVANVLDSRGKKTCLDRDVMQSTDMIDNILNKQPDKHASRF